MDGLVEFCLYLTNPYIVGLVEFSPKISQRIENQSHRVANLKHFICSLIIRLIKFKFEINLKTNFLC